MWASSGASGNQRRLGEPFPVLESDGKTFALGQSRDHLNLLGDGVDPGF